MLSVHQKLSKQLHVQVTVSLKELARAAQEELPILDSRSDSGVISDAHKEAIACHVLRSCGSHRQKQCLAEMGLSLTAEQGLEEEISWLALWS